MDLTDIQLQIMVMVQGLAEIGGLEAAMGNLGTAAGRLTDKNGAMAKGANTSNAAWGSFGNTLTKVEKSYDAIFRAGLHMVILGQQLTQAYSAGKTVIESSVKAWADFQFELNRAAGAIGHIAAGTPMFDALQHGIEKVAQAVGALDPVEVARAMYFWTSATGATIKTQADLQHVLETLTPVLKGVIMQHISMEEAVKGVGGIIRIFNLNITDSTRIMSDLWYLSKKNATELNQLFQAFNYIGPVAKALGISFESMAQTLAMLSDQGMKGSRAGMALQQMLVRLEKPTKQMDTAMTKLLDPTHKLAGGWRSLVFPKGQFEGMTQYIDMLARATMNMLPVQRNYYLSNFTTQRSLQGLIAMVGYATAAIKAHGTGLTDLLTPLKDAQGQFDLTWSNFSQSWIVVIGVFNNSIKPIMYAIGKSAVDSLTPIVQFASKILQMVGDWMEANKSVTSIITKWFGVGVVVLGIAGAFFTALGSILLLAAGIGVVVGAMLPMIATIAFVSAAIIALVVGVSTNVGGIQDSIRKFIGALGDLMTSLLGDTNNMQTNMQSLGKSIGDAFGQGLTQLSGIISNVAGWIESLSKNKDAIAFIRDFGKYLLIIAGTSTALTLVSGAVGLILGPFKGIAEALKGGASLILWIKSLGMIQLLFGGLGTAIKTSWGIIVTVVGGILEAIGAIPIAIIAIIAIIVAVVAAYVTNFMGFRDKVNAVVAQIFKIMGVLGTQIAGVFNNIWSVIVGVAQKIGGVFDPIIKIISAHWNSIITTLQQTFGPIIDGIVKLAGQAAASFVKIAQDVVGFATSVIAHLGPVGDAIGGLVAAVAGLASAIWNDLSTVIGPAWDILVTVVLGAVGIIGTVIAKLIQYVTPIFFSLVSFFISVLEPAFQLVGSIVTTVFNVILSVITTVLNVITGIIKVFTDVLTGNWGKLWDDLLGIVKSIIGAPGKGGIVGVIADIVGGIQSGLSGLAGIVGAIFKGIFDVGGSILTLFAKFLGDAIAFGGNILTSIWNGIVGVWQWWMGVMAAIPSNILGIIKNALGWAGGVFSTLYDIGRNILSSLWQGILSLGGWFKDQLSNLIASLIPGDIKKLLGMSSPSKVMMDIGKNVMVGLGLGITNDPSSLNAMKQHNAALLKIAKDGASQINAAYHGVVAQSNSNIGFTTTTNRSIDLNINVTSADGSVDRLKASEIASALQGSDLASALKHMASVS